MAISTCSSNLFVEGLLFFDVMIRIFRVELMWPRQGGELLTLFFWRPLKAGRVELHLLDAIIVKLDLYNNMLRLF